MNYNYVMGESVCTLTVLDVADILQNRYAFLSGGKSRAGASIITFPDIQNSHEIAEEEYQNVVTYLTSIPTLQEVDLGFAVVIDRRKNGYGKVKDLLQRITNYFPGLVQEVVVLRPNGFLQGTFSNLRFKFQKDEFKFKVSLCATFEELYEIVAPEQLTEDLGGTIKFDHKEWIQDRAAIEKFSANTSHIGQTLQDLCRRLQQTEFPNDVVATESLIQEHQTDKSEVIEDLTQTINHAQGLIKCFKTVRAGNGDHVELPTKDLSANKVAHVASIERLLVQLEETQKNFSEFWVHHEKKLSQCLDLRKFEEGFRQSQFSIDSYTKRMEGIPNEAESLEHVEGQLSRFEEVRDDSVLGMLKAEKLQEDGQKLMDEDHYAVDCIRPKCLELQRMVEQYKEVMRRKHELLQKSRDLHERIDRANKWCTLGLEMLTNQQTEHYKTLEGTTQAIQEIEDFTKGVATLQLNDPREFRNLFEEILSPQTKIMVSDVLKKIDDVQALCQRQKNAFQRLSAKHRAMNPQATVKTPTDQKQSNVGHTQLNGGHIQGDQDSHKPLESMSPEDVLKVKQGHVVRELIDTERIYVLELHNLLRGYADEMDNPNNQNLVPEELIGKKEVLFGNMPDLYRFHNYVFLKALEASKSSPEQIGRCFADRNEEFEMYSNYCQNKPASDSLRRLIGDNHPFFKECQRQLDHKLPLGAYLLKPVQRITKYQLLLKELLKYSQGDEGACQALQEALKTMLSVLKYVNDAMHQISITGFQGDLTQQGKLLMQGPFNVWVNKKDRTEFRFKAQQRHLFLYQKVLLFCKKKEESRQAANKGCYIYKSHLEMTKIGLTENVRGDKKKFEIWLQDKSIVYVVQAPTDDLKECWTKEIKRVLFNQIDQIKEAIRKQMTNLQFTTLPRVQNSEFIEKTEVINHTANVNNNELLSPDSLEEKVEAPSVDSAENDYSLYDEEASWTSDEDGDDSGIEQIIQSTEYIVLADYQPLDLSQIPLKEGEIVEVLKVGSNGWWYVKARSVEKEGWAPCSYLEACNKRLSALSAQSTHSTVSMGSFGKMEDHTEA